MRRSMMTACLILSTLFGCRAEGRREIESYMKDYRATAFVFLAPDCPLSQNYTLTLNNLQKEFRRVSVGLYGVMAGSGLEQKEIDDFVSKYRIHFPVLFDKDWKLTDFFDATITPQAFATDPKGSVIYKGAIDNWSPSLGVHRQVITEHYLSDAIGSLLQGKAVRTKETEAAGCFIERKD